MSLHSFKNLRTLNTLTTVGILVLNYFAARGYINQLDPAEVSAQVQTKITPAGFTFSIWSVIFLLLIGFTIFQYLSVRKYPSRNKIIEAVSTYYFLSFLCMTGWTFAWHNTLFGLSVVFMLGILISLAILFARLVYVKPFIEKKRTRLVSFTAFGIYLGWICVAFTANVSSWLIAIDWSLWSVPLGSWAAGVLTLIFLITLVFLEQFRAIGFAAAVGWGLIGIIAKQQSLDQGSLVVQGFCLVAVLLIVIIIASIFYKRYKKLKEPPIL